MSKLKQLLPVLALALLLTACSDEKPETVILPDKEPNEASVDIDETGTPEEPVSLMILDAVSWFEEDGMLRDYKERMVTKGYETPYKDMLLEDDHGFVKRGLIYEVEDGFAMFEYDAESEEVVAITGFQTVKELEIQEMKTKAFAKEHEMHEEENEAKRALLQEEIDAMWTEIGELEK